MTKQPTPPTTPKWEPCRKPGPCPCYEGCAWYFGPTLKSLKEAAAPSEPRRTTT